MRQALTGGSYQARSLLAGAQSCINLIPEIVPQSAGEPASHAHYPTPGLALLATAATSPWRCLYRATDGGLFGVAGNTVYFIPGGVPAFLMTIGTSTGPVSMIDNGISLIIVDGSANGYLVLLPFVAVGVIVDPAFYGSVKIDIIDGYFVLIKPGTALIYTSSNVNTSPGGPFGSATAWDALDIAASTTNDLLVSLIVNRRELWIFGQTRTEIWTDTGATDFPLAPVSGGIEHGCAAAFSVAKIDGLIFWLSQSRAGHCIVMQGANYEAKRVSTHAIETTFNNFGTFSDAVGWAYQVNGHAIYVLTFPTANQTWCYDLATQEWHQWMSGGGRHRAICYAEASDVPLVGDYATGALYQLRDDTYTDAGTAIQRTRAFPHMEAPDGQRVSFTRLIADIQAGTVPSGAEPLLTLRISDDGGATWGAPITRGMGLAGATLTSLQFRRLGIARRRVFELSWNAPISTTLLGAWIDADVLGS